MVLKKDEEISWIDRVRNEVLHIDKEERKILGTIKLSWSHLAQELPSKTRCWRKEKGKYES
jgi:hypothetical protein